MLFEPYVRFHDFSSVRVTEWPPNRLTICFLGMSTSLGLWSGNVFLIAPFPDHCLLLPLKMYM